MDLGDLGGDCEFEFGTSLKLGLSEADGTFL